MFIPFARSDEGDACPSGHVYCTPTGSILAVSTDPSGAATTTDVDDSPDAGIPANTSTTSNYSSQPGVDRFIGIGMVLFMLFAAILIWLYCTKRSKNRSEAEAGTEADSSSTHRSPYFCCGSRKKPTNWTSAALSTSTTLAPLPNGDSSQFDACSSPKPRTPVVSEKERSLMLQSEPRGLIKEVSGGVVMYTEAPRPALQGRSRYPVDSNWEFERVHGLRYEVGVERS